MEIWKEISGYEGCYAVSSTGRVKSLERDVTLWNGHSIITIHKKSKELVLINDNRGYYVVDLCKNGTVKRYSVHRLVALSFIENPNGYSVVNHIDENTHNNTVENLEWVTTQQNLQHGTRNERISRTLLKSHPAARTILQIDVKTNKVIAKYTSSGDVKRKLGIHDASILRCCNGKAKTCHGYIWKFEKEWLAENAK